MGCRSGSHVGIRQRRTLLVPPAASTWHGTGATPPRGELSALDVTNGRHNPPADPRRCVRPDWRPLIRIGRERLSCAGCGCVRACLAAADAHPSDATRGSRCNRGRYALCALGSLVACTSTSWARCHWQRTAASIAVVRRDVGIGFRYAAGIPRRGVDRGRAVRLLPQPDRLVGTTRGGPRGRCQRHGHTDTYPFVRQLVSSLGVTTAAS